MSVQTALRSRGRGFASMDRSKQQEIASRGGRAAHAQGTAHTFSPEEARQAGYKGGKKVSINREHMASIGRRGGKARHQSAAHAGKDAADDQIGENANRPVQHSSGTPYSK